MAESSYTDQKESSWDQEKNEMTTRIILDLKYFHTTWFKSKSEQLGFNGEDTFFVKPKLKADNRELDMEEIITNEDRGKVILIEGEDGYGKTMLIRKLAYDWAVMNSAWTLLFNLAFVIDLKEIKTSLYKSIVDSVQEKARESLTDLITYQPQDIVVILDGFDEASIKLRKQIIQELQDHAINNMTIVLTCSPSHSRTISQYCQKRIFIEGLQELGLDHFDANHFESGDLHLAAFHEVTTQFSRLSKNENYLKRPFLQMGMRSICHNYLPDTAYTIYEELIHFIVMDSICKERYKQQPSSQKLNVLVVCGQLISYFLHKNQIKLVSEKLCLEKVEVLLNEDIFQKLVSPLTTEHLNDILYSFYLSHLAETDKEKFSGELKSFIQIRNSLASYVCPLVFKTVDRKSIWFQTIEASFLSDSSISVQKLLKTVGESETTLLTLRTLLSKNESSILLSIWPLTVELFPEEVLSVFKDTTMDVVMKHLMLVSMFFERNSLTKTPVPTEPLMSAMPTWWNLKVSINTESVCVANQTEQAIVHHLTGKHHISKLFIVQTDTSSSEKSELSQYIATTSKFQSVVITGQQGFLSKLLKKIEEIRIKALVLHRCILNKEDMQALSCRLLNPQVTSIALDCCTFHTDCEIEPLMPVLQALSRKQCQLKTFHIIETGLNRTQLHKFFAEVSRSKTLTELDLQSLGECNVNINTLCNFGQKKWQSLMLNGLSVSIPPEAVSIPFSITALSLQNVRDNEDSNIIKVLRNCKVRALHCDDVILQRLSEELEDDWVGYKLVKDLKVRSGDVSLLLSQASRFEQLLTLEWEIVSSTSEWLLSHSAREWITSIRSWRMQSFKLKQDVPPTVFLQNLQAIFNALDDAPLPLDDAPFATMFEFGLQPTWEAEQFNACLSLVKNFVSLILLTRKVKKILISLLEFQRWNPVPPLHLLEELFSKNNFNVCKQIQEHTQWDDYVISIERRTFF